MNLNIRRATKNEHPLLLNLWESSVRASHHFITETDIADYRTLLEKEYLPKTSLYCLVEGLNPLGFVGIAGNTITQLFIHPSCFQRGLGSALLNFAVQRKGANHVAVNEQNHVARNFYMKNGFEVDRRFAEDGAGKPYPVLAMSRKLAKHLPLMRRLMNSLFW